MAEKVEERIYTIPLRDAFNAPRTKRANKAVKIVREFLVRHFKIGKTHPSEEDIMLDNSVNEAIWERGIKKPPRRIRVSVTESEGKVIASLAE